MRGVGKGRVNSAGERRCRASKSRQWEQRRKLTFVGLFKEVSSSPGWPWICYVAEVHFVGLDPPALSPLPHHQVYRSVLLCPVYASTGDGTQAFI